MKIQNLLSGFALAALLALGAPGIHQTANAQSGGEWTCDNGPNPVPANYDGSAGIQRNNAPNSIEPLDCVLGNKHVTGSFGVIGYASVTYGSITADNGWVVLRDPATGGEVTAGSHVEIDNAVNIGNVTAGTATDGHVLIGGSNVIVGGITNTGQSLPNGSIEVFATDSMQIASINNSYGGILLQSAGSIQVPEITNKNGDIRIFANHLQTSGDPLVVGSGGIGNIHNNGDYGWGIYINSPTGIDYNGTDLLQTHADSGAPGYVYLDGGTTGTVTLVGSIVVDKSDGAGAIAIFAPEIVTNGATLSASADPGSPAGYINLITTQVTKTGALTINNNGDGGFAADIHLGITPADSWSVDPDQTNPDVPLVTGSFQASSQPLSITGSGLLTITANGDNHAVQIYGYPLTLTSASITQHGVGDALYVQSTDYVNNVNGVLTLGGNVELHENTNATGPTNVLDIRGTSLASLSGHVQFDTSGLSGADGGDLTLPFDSGTVTLGASSMTLDIKADGSDSGGKGGTIQIGYGGTFALEFDTGYALSSSAKGGDGDGGSVTVNADSISLGDGELHADGFGNGAGGTIVLQPTSPIEMEHVTAITALGGESGDGGHVTLYDDGNFALYDVVKIDPEAGASSSLARRVGPRFTHAGGDITRGLPDEQVTCYQYFIGPINWPVFYDCTSAGQSPPSLDSVPSYTLSDAVFVNVLPLITSSNWNPNIFIFDDYNNYNKWHGWQNDPDKREVRATGSVTYRWPNTKDIEVGIWHEGSIGNPDPNSAVSFDANKTQEVTAHELGHTYDITQSFPSKTSAYDAYLRRDIFDLKWVPDSSQPGAFKFTARNPCGATVLHNGTVLSDTAPFVGVTDPVFGAVCDDFHHLTPYFASIGDNEAILVNLEPGLFVTTDSRPAWVEVHAQVFAYTSIGAKGSRPMFDTVLDNGFVSPLTIPDRFFGCVKAWARFELSGVFGPPSPPNTPSGSCAVAP